MGVYRLSIITFYVCNCAFNHYALKYLPLLKACAHRNIRFRNNKFDGYNYSIPNTLNELECQKKCQKLGNCDFWNYFKDGASGG